MEFGRRAQAWLDEGPEEQRRQLGIFCAGAALYMKRHGDTVDPVILRVLPVGPVDILAVTQYVIHYNAMPEQWNLPSVIASWRQGKSISSFDVSRLDASGLYSARRGAWGGSNAWALAPKKSVSGHAILMGNPHLPWGANQPVPDLDIAQLFEAHLVVGDPERPSLNAHGASFAGAPYLGIAFTDDIGWTHTYNTLKNADLYEITLSGPDEYIFDGQKRRLEQRQEEIRTLQPDGSFATTRITVANTVHGPIVAQRDDGRALALRVAGLDGKAIMTQYWNMLRSRNLGEFISAIEPLQMPFFNIVYADRHGDIMYAFGGKQPVRDGGVFADYLGVLDGSAPAALWTETLPFGALPKVINPEGGFVQNANDPPWTSTFPPALDPADFPRWISPAYMQLRAQHGAAFLTSKEKFTVDEVIEGKESTRLELAVRLAPDLIAAARASGDPVARQAAAVLEAWDRTADAASKGGSLFERWYEIYVGAPETRRSPALGRADYPAFRTEWRAAEPLTTPVGLADPAGAVPALVQAAEELQKNHGAMDVDWGTVHRVALVAHDGAYAHAVTVAEAPQSGAADIYGPLRVIDSFPTDAARTAFGGDSYVQVVEFDPSAGASAWTLLTYGNASRPGSDHIADQLPVFSAKTLRPVMRKRQDVLTAGVSADTY